jgi:hypothetical protein
MSFEVSREEPLIQLSSDDNSTILHNLTDKTHEILETHLKETPTEQFNTFLIEAIDESLILLGEPVKNEFYLQLELKFNIKKTDIPLRLEEFSDILHKVFGLGASRLEVKFLRKLDLKIPSGSKCIDADCSVSTWIEKEKSLIKTINTKRQDFLLNSK